MKHGILYSLLTLTLTYSVADAADETKKEVDGQAQQAIGEVEEVFVVGKQIAGPKFDIKSTRTTFDLEAIQNLQPSSVFDVLSKVPGVDLTGGPRSNGIAINIRGFSDNEDVLVIVDGAVKNFEKYRFGSVMPEPELLRELTVSRGPASVLQGSGAIGGVIEMQTRNASDFLEGSDRLGGFTKFGYANNDNELLFVGSLYGRPSETTDVLVSFTKRDSDNLELSTGEELSNSAASPEALLAKVEWHSNIALLGFAYSATFTEGREWFDTSVFSNGVNGEVYRETEDNTWSSYYNINPASELIDANFSIAYTDTVVDERSINSDGEILVRGWDYQYDIWSARMHNTATLFSSANQQFKLDFGVQALEEERTTENVNAEGNRSIGSMMSQPSGVTLNWGSYLQATWDVYGLTATVGYRNDHNNTEVLLAESREIFQAHGAPVKIEQQEDLLNYRLDYRFQSLPITLFHSYVQAVRYPKLDEYFTQGGFSRCLSSSSDAEQVLSRLQTSEQSTAQTISEGNAKAVADINNFTNAENLERNRQIEGLNAARDAWILDALIALNNGSWTQAQYDTEFAIMNTATEASINVANLTADNNINIKTTLINNTLATNNASLQSDHDTLLADAGLDPGADLSSVDFPTKTTLPEPHQSLQFCGALYEPETAENWEWGISYAVDDLLASNDALILKLTHFETRVDNLLQSINTNPNDPASQPGKEKVWGYELESTYFIEGWRFDLTYSKSKGEISGYNVVTNPAGTGSLHDTMSVYQTREKMDMPADEVALTTSWINQDLTLELGMRISHKTSRLALESIDSFSPDTIVAEQPSITELNLIGVWKPYRHTHLRLAIDNLTNESYKTSAGITDTGELILGNHNTGRNIKVSFTQYF